jgi:hypothetical protein
MKTTPPSKAEVETHVKWYIAGYTQLPPGKIDSSWVLKESQLSFDDTELGFLALSLRGYVQHYKANATVLASETRKKGLTVEGLATLIYGKIK